MKANRIVFMSLSHRVLAKVVRLEFDYTPRAALGQAELLERIADVNRIFASNNCGHNWGKDATLGGRKLEAGEINPLRRPSASMPPARVSLNWFRWGRAG